MDVMDRGNIFQFSQFIWFTLTIFASAQAVCPRNQSELSWFVPPAEHIESDQRHYVGMRWNIDCRLNGSAGSEAILLQERSKDAPWRKRFPDENILKQEQQVFTLLSLNDSDVGHYHCQVCNKTKYVGELSVDTSYPAPVVDPQTQKPIPFGSNVTYTCKVQGAYIMSWHRVATNGSRTLVKSTDNSSWGVRFRNTRRQLGFSNFTASDEGLYMCLIRRAGNKSSAEKEIYLRLQRKNLGNSLPINWYYTSFSKKEIEGHLMRFILHVYSCHLPVIVSLQVYIPIKGIAWERNFTADQTSTVRLGRNSKYGIQLWMHVHWEGKYKDHLNVTVRLVNLKSNLTWNVMNQNFDQNTECDRETCHRPASSVLECPRYLDDLDENLNASFILTLKNPCAKTFNLQVRDRDSANTANNTLLDMDFENNTQTRMELKGFNNNAILSSAVQGRVKFAQWYLTLTVDDNSTNIHRVKLMFDMPDVNLTGKFVIMEGDYIMDSQCSSGQSGGNKTKTITLAIIIPLLVVLLVLVATLMYRRCKTHSGNEFLLTTMEYDDSL